jgi:transposase
VEQYETLAREQLISIIVNRDRELEKLMNQFRQMQKHLYGKKSEKLIGDQQQSLFELKEVAVPETTTIEVATHKRELVRGRKPLPKDLPRERIEYLPEDKACSCCGKELSKIGEETTEELEYIPARFFIKEHVKIKMACSKCKTGVKTGEVPAGMQIIDKSRPGAGLISHIVLSKYCDHLPLYRQEQIFLRHGIAIPRQRMCDWIAATTDLLEPLYNAINKEILSLSYLQADETTIQVRDLESKDNMLTGYFWGLHGPPEKLAYFEYFPSRAGASAKELLDGFAGVVQTDYYAGYNAVLLPDKVSRLACLAHVRRKFIEVQKSFPRECDVVLRLISELYKLEVLSKDFNFDKRKAFRNVKAAPLLEKLQKYLSDIQAQTLPRALLQQPINYALSQWKEILRYLDDGRFQIDNNAIERQIRPIALGRKNYLFAGSHDGAKRAAMLYTFIACCKLNKVNPYDWFTDVLRKVHTHPINRVAELLPHNWTKPA